MPISITIVYSPAPRETREWNVEVPDSLTIEEAIARFVAPEYPELLVANALVGIWGRTSEPETSLKQGDRLEIYRPLTVDPKIARRKRFKSQGTRGAGLFAKKKVGKEAGY